MVNGISIFREHFSNFKDQYTVIGGFACDLLMNDAGLDFRKTVDIDMVLTVEALTADFAKAFWSFIEAGGYQARQRSNGKPEFYRFVDPTNPAYPKMIGFLLDGRTVTDGISILDAEHIIPLKMKAWLDLKSKKAEGLHVNARDIKKHRLDVFRLFQLVREGQKITVPKSVGEDITQFIAQMRETEIRLTDIDINRPKDSILDIYSNIYVTE